MAGSNFCLRAATRGSSPRVPLGPFFPRARMVADEPSLRLLRDSAALLEKALEVQALGLTFQEHFLK